MSCVGPVSAGRTPALVRPTAGARVPSPDGRGNTRRAPYQCLRPATRPTGRRPSRKNRSQRAPPGRPAAAARLGRRRLAAPSTQVPGASKATSPAPLVPDAANDTGPAPAGAASLPKALSKHDGRPDAVAALPLTRGGRARRTRRAVGEDVLPG